MAKKGYKANRTSYKKGTSGNPGGRPRMDPKVVEILKAATPHAARRLVEALDATMVVHYQGVEVGTYIDHETRIKAAEAIKNRLYGKPEYATATDELQIQKLKAEVALAEAKVKEQGGERGGTINVIMPKFDDDKDGEDK